MDPKKTSLSRHAVTAKSGRTDVQRPANWNDRSHSWEDSNAGREEVKILNGSATAKCVKSEAGMGCYEWNQ